MKKVLQLLVTMRRTKGIENPYISKCSFNLSAKNPKYLCQTLPLVADWPIHAIIPQIWVEVLSPCHTSTFLARQGMVYVEMFSTYACVGHILGCPLVVYLHSIIEFLLMQDKILSLKRKTAQPT